MKRKSQTVFIIFNGFGLGGVQRKIVDLSNAITSEPQYQHINLHLIFFNKMEDEFPFAKLLHSEKITIHNGTNLHGRKKKIVFIFQLMRLIAIHQPDSILLFLHFLAPYVMLTKLLYGWKKIRYVISQDNIFSLENRLPYVDRVMPLWLLRPAYQFADAFITQTELAKKDLIKTFTLPADEISVIPNWALTQKQKFLNQDIDVLYCGRFSAQKKVEKILDLLSQVKKSLPTLKAQLIGGGDTHTIQRLVARIFDLQLGQHVEMLYPSLEVERHVARAKILVLTSDFEGMPLVVLEAMALGVVPMVLRFPGVEEYITHGVTGFYFNSVSQMAKRMTKLLKQPSVRRRIAQHAKLDAKKRFHMPNVHRTIATILPSNE